ncbi:MAG: Sialic acid TRAP transporter permease protein SiaT [Smithella sp. PtaU1.Bin162]|nr:MAG: Sialic acid TRAP transporter permease protein SiaT [Smithella sp. PtaU1.Bin162]
MAFTLFIVAIFLLIFGAPIAICLGLGAAAAFFFSGSMPLLIVPQRMFGGTDSFPLMAIPFFVLAGNLMAAGGISKRLIAFANTLTGHITGGLAICSVLGGMFFAAISGSGAATTAALGSILIPAMVLKGYNREFSGAVQACSGAIGIIIPPSIPMVLYGVGACVSIGDLFMGGFGPGIVMGLCLMITSYFISRKDGYGGREKRSNFREIGKAFKDSILALFMPVIILGGIYAGVFTPTEAAVVAVVYGYIVSAWIYRELDFKGVQKALSSTVITSAIIMFIIGCAAIFAVVLTREKIPQQIAATLLSLSKNPIVLLMIINVFLLFIGAIMETAAALIILTPILVPIVLAVGINPVHFGVVMVTNLGIGLVTPPVGINLYVAASISGSRMEPLAKRAIPLLAAMVVALLIISYVPQLTLYPVELLNSLRN